MTGAHIQRRADMLAALADDLARVLTVVNECYVYRPEPAGRDDWRTPDEMLRMGGDCEDFAIAYWWLIRSARLPGEARVARLDAQPPHMVCLHYGPDSADPWVLDVRADAVYRLPEAPARVVFELGVSPRGRARCWVGVQQVAVPGAWTRVLARLDGGG